MDSASTSPGTISAPEESFQPGQLGMRHLLGVMTVAAIILGVSAARLRTLKPLEVGCVAGHWTIVLGVTCATFWLGSWRRRRDRAAAGELLLRVLSKPMTERRRTAIKWGLTALVVADGILISLFLPYTGLMPGSVAKTGVAAVQILMYVALQGMRPNEAFWEGAMWGWCLSYWLANIYWVELREHGILTHSGYMSWTGMSRLGWSTVHPNRLVFFQGGHFREIPIDPAAHAAVSALLAKRIAAPSPAGETRLG